MFCLNQLDVNVLLNAHIKYDLFSRTVYLFHAELTFLQGLTEAHLPMEETPLVYECGNLLEALTYWNAF